jgi:hypothetical protein
MLTVLLSKAKTNDKLDVYLFAICVNNVHLNLLNSLIYDNRFTISIKLFLGYSFIRLASDELGTFRRIIIYFNICRMPTDINSLMLFAMVLLRVALANTDCLYNRTSRVILRLLYRL